MSVAAVGRPSVSPGGRQYTLVRTRRRTIAVYIRAGGRVEVRAPLGATKAGIDDFVDSRSQWIDRHAALSAARFEQASQFAVVPGCSLLWQGQTYPAVLQEGCRVRFDGERFLLPSRSHEENKSAMLGLYRETAETVLRRRTIVFAESLGLSPRSVKITGAKTRWGSCSDTNALCFAWRLLLTPPACMDYVIVHELCHMRQHNHSAAFWQEVERVLPDYRARRALLKEYGRRIALQDWN